MTVMLAEIPESDISLRDGRVVHLRAVRAADEDEFLQAFARIDNDARYMRFMRNVREPNVERLRNVLASFPASGIGIIATAPAADGFDIVGSAIYLIEGDTCEFAITVAADYGGTGLGSTLMKTLIESARSRCLREMHGYVLSINEPMLRLAKRLGFSVGRDPDDPTVRLCRLPLTGA